MPIRPSAQLSHVVRQRISCLLPTYYRYLLDLQMVRYEDFRHKNAYLYDCDAFALQKVKHVYGGVLPESPNNGRIILMRFGE